ncbi:hypothetical protein [Aureibacter tunicatorum]|uniref:Uncharacterized protein n=1 Tax=Aureibacter tunicatorum TaxID=866807 RepID=A0AAE3XU79_9BACT|nr:hypothetical protein [Aureibacter tunicatorum]MDR6241966.1 hypothetical protein [Aureibacter tunicatorum]BDD07519.1 hypothetical protein AUTU_50020 [Aureibacter tunicatorum]
MKDKVQEILKEEHGELYELEVPYSSQNKESVKAYLKKPSRKVLSAFLSKVNMDPLGAYELLLKNCWVKGDKKILEEDELLMSACSSLEPLVSYRQSTLKKI